MTAYYNEIDPAAAAVLRHLVSLGVIAPGDVDTRSIKDVQPDDLAPYTQCHFFAGGGLWSVAARLAGWEDARPLWTGSCPCQPYSAAGKRGGDDDPRNLWPDFHRLISARRPAVVVGEQVAGAAGYGWFDGVGADLARENYASRSVDIPASAVDAPHQRNRLYWVAVADAEELSRGTGLRQDDAERHGSVVADGDGGSGPLADPLSGERDGRPIEPERGPQGRDAAFGPDARSGRDDGTGVTQGDAFGTRLEGHAGHGDGERGPEQDRPVAPADGSGAAGGMGDAPSRGGPRGGEREAHHGQEGSGEPRGPDRRNGSHWADAEWIVCHDGKARRTKPGLRLLVDGLPGRVDLWRVGGNAIVPVEAAEVIKALMETLDQ